MSENVNLNEAKMISMVRERAIAKLTIAGGIVEEAAKNLCTVDTGNLKDSIGFEVNREDLSVTIGTNVEYAPYVEFGTGELAEEGNGRKGGWFYKDDKGVTHFTRGMKPQPFLRPGFIQSKNKIIDILRR